MSGDDWRERAGRMFKERNLRDFLRQRSVQMVLGGGGLILVGVLYIEILAQRNDKSDNVEIIPAEERVLGDDVAQAVIWVDVAGAVEKPGVYELAQGSRVNEALIVAGGLSLRADRSWVGRYLNRAQVLGDGVKIYVPEKGEGLSDPGSYINHDPGSIQGIISINTGSKTELDSLWGIGEIRAEAIINNRPYQSMEELKTKANIPQNVIDRNKAKMSL